MTVPACTGNPTSGFIVPATPSLSFLLCHVPASVQDVLGTPVRIERMGIITNRTPTPDYVGEFSLSITEAMRTQLMAALIDLVKVPLTPENSASIERRPGIYQLFLDGTSVYIGKADDNLNARVGQHYRKISGRTDTDGDPTNGRLVDRMIFRCMYINEDIDSLGPEKMLIQEFRQNQEAVWNNNGFGNKDPGKERDTSAVKWLHFDRQFQIDLDLPIIPDNRRTARRVHPVDDLWEAMGVIKAALPFVFRYGTTPADKRELTAVDTLNEDVAGVTRSVREWLDWLADRLPDGWKIIALPGYVLAYKNPDLGKYRSRMFIWHARGGTHDYEVNPEPEWATGTVPEES